MADHRQKAAVWSGEGMRQRLADLSRADVRRFGEALGVTMPRGRSRSGRCPFAEHPDRRPSFWISPDGCRWKCFGCGRSGNAVQLAREVLGCDLRSAMEAVSTWVAGEPLWVTVPGSKSAETTTPPVHATPDVAVYSRLMELCPLRRRGRDYLISRGIDERISEIARIGEVVDDEQVARILRRDFSMWQLVDAGVLSASNDCRLIFGSPGLIFPFFEEGNLVCLQARSLRLGASRWMGLRGQRKRPYRLLIGGSAVWLCEGVTDALSAAQLGHDAIGLLGADSSPDAGTLTILRGRDVYVVGDNDDRGRHFARRMLKLLASNSIAADEIRLPMNRGDLNEWIKSEVPHA